MGQFTIIAKMMKLATILILSLTATGTVAVFTTSICQELLTERRLYAGLFGGFVPYPINSLLDRKLSYWECLPENTERPVTDHPRIPVHKPTHKPHTETSTPFKPTFIVDPNNPCIGEFWEEDGNGGVVTIGRNICNQPTKPTTPTPKPVTQKPTTHKPHTQRPTQKPTTTFTPTFIVGPNNPCIGEFREKDGNGGVVTIRRNICNQPTKPTTTTREPVTQKPTTHKPHTQRPTHKPHPQRPTQKPTT